MRTRPLPRTFSSGELAPWVDGITNELTQKGCRTLENFIVKKQGQALRRPGTYFVNEVKDSADDTILVPVTIDDDNTYVLEIGDAYIRFYQNHARVTYPSTTTIYEVTSPWSTGELSTLSWMYVPDDGSILLAHPNHTEQRLVYTSSASWTLNPLPIIQGPAIRVMSMWKSMWKSEDGTTWVKDDIGIDTNASTYLNVASTEFATLVSMAGEVKKYDERDNLWTSVITPDSCLGMDSDGRSMLVGTGATGSTTFMASYDNGATWKATQSSTALLKSVAFDRQYAKWMAVGTTSRYYSNNGVSWTSMTETHSFRSISPHLSDGSWVAVGDGTIQYASSVAASWVSITTFASLAFRSVTCGNPGGTPLWVAVGESSAHSAIIYTSPTGSVWTNQYRDNSDVTELTAVKWVGSKYFAAGPDSGVGKTALLESFNGTSWTTVSAMTFTDAPVLGRISYTRLFDVTYLNESGNYPSKMSYNEGRVVVVPASEPSSIYGSTVAKPGNFYVGPYANNAFKYTIQSDRNVDIQWMMGGFGGLVVGTRTAEGILVGSPDEGITPNTAQFKWLSTFGSSSVQPVRVHDTIVFVQRGGEVIRGYVPASNAYQSPDLTAYADHIAEGGVTELDHQDDPQSIVYAVRSDGQLLALTFDNGMRAWSRIVTDGAIESVAVIPTTGAEDEIWMVVNRTIGGSTKRYIEYMDTLAVSSVLSAHYVDSGVYASSATTFATVGSLTHLAGETVDALINGTRWISGLTVSASGTIALAPYSGTSVHAGLPYTSYLQTMRGDYGSAWGDGAGLNKRTSEILCWVHDSSALAKFGPTTTLATESIVYSSSTTLNTEVVKVNFPGQYDRDNYIWCVVSDPRPFTLVAMLADSETGDR